MPKINRKLIPIETDFHGNHTSGLLNPRTKLVEYDSDGAKREFEPDLSLTQEYLWQLRTDNIGKLLALSGRDPMYYFHGGDQTQGYKHPTDYVSSNHANEFEIAKWNVAPIAELRGIRAMRFCQGTMAHDGFLGATAQALQRSYEEKWPKLDIQTVWHGLISIGGYRIDYAHHGPNAGSKEWLNGNGARSYLKDAMIKAFKFGEEPADLYIRGHVHETVWEVVNMFWGGRWYTSTLLVVPSMCGLSAYAVQSTRSTPRITNGMCVVEVIDNRTHNVHWFTETRDIRTKEYI